jgi:hypothetical protein
MACVRKPLGKETFGSRDQLQKWWNGPEWQAAHKEGEQYAKFRDMASEGVGP